MKFGPVSIAASEGAILAHSVVVGARRLAKGTILGAAEVAALGAAGADKVIVAQLEAGDVHEDAAATAIATALAGPGLAVDRAATGRVNLRAETAGIIAVDAGAINAVNRIDPAVTVATVPEWQRLGPGGLVATIKIIPFAAPGWAVEAACAVGEAVWFMAPVVRSATLIETEVGVAPRDKGRRSTQTRLARLGVDLSSRVVVPHRSEPIAAAIAAAPGEMVLILTGSATSDGHDVGPEAVRAAGGEIIRYGMPVDPGNLIFTGRAGGKPVIGLPGCARSPALNGADWVMERVICGVPPEEIDIAGMGVGGLLKEIPSRPRPRGG